MQSEEEIIELVDATDRPLMVIPRSHIHRYNLFRRVVFVALKDFKGRVYIQQRGKNCVLPEYWDLSATGHVHAGESREDAAYRELAEEIGIRRVRLIRVIERGPTEVSASFGTLYLAGPTGETPIPNPCEVAAGMFLDKDELAALLKYDAEHITPVLSWAFHAGLLFK